MDKIDGLSSASKASQAPQVDGLSSASQKCFYQEGSFTKEEALEKINARVGAIMLATVNPDATPNLAVFVPKVASSNHLMFGLYENQSRKNIFRNKKAILGLYQYEKENGDKFIQNQGARLILTLEEGEKTLAELQRKFPQPGLIFMKIEKVLPLG